MHIAWASSSGQIFHTVSAPTGLQMQTGHDAQCSPLLPIPQHTNWLLLRSPQGPPSPFQVCARHLPDGLQHHELHTDPWQHTQPSLGNPRLPWCGVPPRSQNRVCLWTQQALQVGTAQHLTAVWRAKGVTHFTEEKLLCSGVTGKKLEQRASLSSQSDRGKSNRNLGLSREKESYSQCGNRAKGSL